MCVLVRYTRHVFTLQIANHLGVSQDAHNPVHPRTATASAASQQQLQQHCIAKADTTQHMARQLLGSTATPHIAGCDTTHRSDLLGQCKPACKAPAHTKPAAILKSAAVGSTCSSGTEIEAPSRQFMVCYTNTGDAACDCAHSPYRPLVKRARTKQSVAAKVLAAACAHS